MLCWTVESDLVCLLEDRLGCALFQRVLCCCSFPFACLLALFIFSIVTLMRLFLIYVLIYLSKTNKEDEKQVLKNEWIKLNNYYFRTQNLVNSQLASKFK